MFPTTRTIFALMLREMSTTYGRSPGGYIWAVLEPAVGILLLTAIFSAAFRTPPLGVNFPIFYASGLVPFTLFLTVNGKMGIALLFSKPLLEYPTVTFVDALLARFLTNVITQLMVAYVIIGFILIAYATQTILDMPRIILGFTMAASLALGIGTMNCFLISRYPVWQQIWSIVNRPLFLISCVFYTFETIPAPFNDYLWWNPIVHVVGVTRSGFYSYYDAAYASPLYVFGLSIGLTCFGLLFLQRQYKDLMER